MMEEESFEDEIVVPYFPSPVGVIEAVLDLVELTPNDVFLDLGCGDGRVATAAAERGARALGIDISQKRVTAARLRAEKYGADVAMRCGFECADFLHADFTIPEDASVIYIFGSPSLMGKLTRNHCLNRKLQIAVFRGARVVTYGFHWDAVHQETNNGDMNIVQREVRRGALQMTQLDQLVQQMSLSSMD